MRNLLSQLDRMSYLAEIQCLTGWYYVGVLQDGRFVVEQTGPWIS